MPDDALSGPEWDFLREEDPVAAPPPPAPNELTEGQDAPPAASDYRAVALDALSGTAPEPGAPKPDPILSVDTVLRRFGGLTAVDVAHVEVQRHSITALIGPNGA